jgi:signal transduction histidine kinase
MNFASSAPLSHHDEPPGDLIAELGVMHPMSLAIDASGRILWMSDGLGEALGGSRIQLGCEWMDLVAVGSAQGSAAALHRELLSRIGRGPLRVEFEDATGGTRLFDLSVLPLEDADCLALAFRPEPDCSVTTMHGRNEALRSVLDALPDAVIALDPSGHVFCANTEASRLFERPLSEIIERPVAELLPSEPERASLAKCIRFGAAAGEQVVPVAGRGQHAVAASISARSLEIPGAPRCQLLTLSVEDSVEAEKQRLKQQVAELENCVHSVSHDLRSPLVSLLGFTRLLQQDYEDQLDETGRHFLHRIEQAGHSMDALISDLLAISKIGHPGESRDLVDPRSVLLQLNAELKPRLEEQGVTLHIPTDPPLLLCNRTRVYQLFSNLVGNALMHMGPCENPTVSIEVESEPGCDHITVADNGRGIEADGHQRIFEMFHTLGSRSGDDGSTGIGLAIVKKIAETHDGRAWVESEPGLGARFHVTLAH